MGGLHPSVFVMEDDQPKQCLGFKFVTEDLWEGHLADLKAEAELNEQVRRRAMDGEVKSSNLLPAEYVMMKRKKNE